MFALSTKLSPSLSPTRNQQPYRYGASFNIQSTFCIPFRLSAFRHLLQPLCVPLSFVVNFLFHVLTTSVFLFSFLFLLVFCRLLSRHIITTIDTRSSLILKLLDFLPDFALLLSIKHRITSFMQIHWLQCAFNEPKWRFNGSLARGAGELRFWRTTNTLVVIIVYYLVKFVCGG